MPSLFSRPSPNAGSKKEKRPTINSLFLPEQAKTVPARTARRPFDRPPPDSHLEEFGLITKTTYVPPSPSSPAPWTSPGGTSPPVFPPKYVYLPTKLPLQSPTLNSVDSFAYGTDEATARREYGFLGAVAKEVVLGPDEVARVIREVGAELGSRGLATPLLFSNQALELNQTRTKALIQSYLSTLPSKTQLPLKTKLDAFQQDLHFAREYELAWFLRWALAKMTRIREGTRELCHGCIDWDVYEEWRGRERAANYPADAFPYLSSLLPSDVFNQIITPLFSLLTRLAAHSHLSGLTPHALASLFAPLLFDIPASSPCITAHSIFVRAACATEHLLLSHIRSSGRRDGLGVSDLPSRLQEWVKGYPAMVATDAEMAHAHPRKGSRVVRCQAASRTVRAYSRDLVATAELWANEIPGGWEAWQRVLPGNQRPNGSETSRPKFSASWRRRMCVKETLPLPPYAESSLLGDMRYGLADMPELKNKEIGRVGVRRGGSEDEGDEGKWESLAGKEWSAFEEAGFDAPILSLSLTPAADIRRKLEFDLNESAKLSLSERRQTLDWTDFAAPEGGFNRTDPFLTASLTFSAPVEESIHDWPKERVELRRRLQKTQKDSVPFHYDTTPRIGAFLGMEGADVKGWVWVEEAFIDCWADLMMGCAWSDRDELTFKEANWALIEYKAKPSRPNEDEPHPSSDPRTTELYFLFEEHVPADYQMAVADPKRRTLLSNLFSSRKKRQASDSHSYVPLSPEAANTRTHGARSGFRNDFDRMLLSRRQPRRLALSSRNDNPSASVWHMAQETDEQSPTSPGVALAARLEDVSPTTPKLPVRPRTRSDGGAASAAIQKQEKQDGNDETGSRPRDDHQSPLIGDIAAGKPRQNGSGGSRFLRSIRRSKSNQENRDKAKKQRETQADFEIVSASGASSGWTSPNDGISRSDEKWMDILIANGAKRMDRQDAILSDRLNTNPKPKAQPNRIVSGGKSSPDPVPGETDDHSTPTAADFQSVEEEEILTDENYEVVRTEHDRTPSSPLRPDDSISHHFVSPTTEETHQYFYEDQEGNAFDDTGVEGVDGNEFGHGTNGARQTGDGPGRDTIHSVVERYRDSSASTMTASSTNDSGFTILHEEDIHYHAQPRSAFGGAEGLIGIASPEPRRHDGVRVENQGWEGGGGLTPPSLERIFDLTPGREPSPARYKHGEPLQLVGEVPEEEEYY